MFRCRSVCIIEVKVSWKGVSVHRNWVSVLLCVFYCMCCTVPVLAELQLPQPQPWAERVARVGMVPDCRQAHYLSLAKKKKKNLIIQKNTLTKRESIYLLPDLERVPIAFHVATCAHTHIMGLANWVLHCCRWSVTWVCPCFGAWRVRSEVFAL